MRALKMHYIDGVASIDWGATVEGIELLKQKVVGNFMVRQGTDQFIPERGTELETTLMSRGVPDIMRVQHALNFAAMKAKQDIGTNTVDPDSATTLKKFQMSLVNIVEGKVQVQLQITNADDVSIGELTSL